jgi:hypothetical protein
MTFIPATNVAKVVIQGVVDAQTMNNVIHFHKATPITGGDLTGLLSALDAWMASAVMPIRASSAYYTGLTAVDISAPNNFVYQLVRSPALQGGVTGAALPGVCAPVTTKRSTHNGRSFRGRFYNWGVPSAAINTPSSITGAQVTSVLSALAPLINDALVSGLFHVVLSLFSGVDSNHKPIPRSSGIATNVTALSMDTSIDAQRRRLIGRGI